MRYYASVSLLKFSLATGLCSLIVFGIILSSFVEITRHVSFDSKNYAANQLNFNISDEYREISIFVQVIHCNHYILFAAWVLFWF